MAQDQDRRAETRHTESIRFVFNHAARRSTVVSTNISRSGAFFLATSNFPAGTLLVLEFPESVYGARGLRIMAKVAHSRRGFPVKGKDMGMGVRWVRAFCAGGVDTLGRFLKGVLGLPGEAVLQVTKSELGEAVYDFPAIDSSRDSQSTPAPTEAEKSAPATLTKDHLGHQKLQAVQRTRFLVRAPVVFSLDNMHYQGRATSIGPDGLTVETAMGLPSQFCKVTVRYPLHPGRLGERVLLFGEVDLVVQGAAGQPGVFNVTLTGLDEQDDPGAFRSYLRGLARERG